MMADNDFKRRRFAINQARRMRRKIVRGTLITLAVIALFALVLLGVNYLETLSNRRQSERQQQYEAETAEMKTELSRLQSLLNTLDDRYTQPLGCKAAISIIAISTREDFIEALYPLFLETGSEGESLSPCVLGLSPTNLPGLEGNISLERYRELQSLGWGSCLFYDNAWDDKITEEALADWLTEMSLALDGMNIELPRSVFFDHAYRRELDPVLRQFGIETAIHREGTQYPVIELTAGNEGVWHPGGVGWNSVAISQVVKNSAVYGGGYFAFTVGRGLAVKDDNNTQVLDKTTSIETTELFVINIEKYAITFKNMMDNLRAHRDKAELKITTVEGGREFRLDYLARLDATADAKAAEKADIQARMSAITKEMMEIMKKYELD